MAEPARFIFKVRTEKKLGNIPIDAFIQETHSRTNTLTRYPVEEGANITDHIQNQPEIINISCIIEAKDDGSNIIENFIEIDKLFKNKELISVVSGLKVYTNMVITNLSIPRTARNGGSLSFSASLEEIRIVNSQAVSIPNTQISNADSETNKQAQATQDIGKATSGQTQETNEQASSFLAQVDAQIDDIFGGF